MKRFSFTTALLVCVCFCLTLCDSVSGQSEEQLQAVEAAAREIAANAVQAAGGLDPGGSEDAAIEVDDEPVIDSATLNRPTTQRQKFIRFHMWDGAIVGGEVQADRLKVKTEFGTLMIPIDRIRSFNPGLDSFPERDAEIARLVKDLGDRNYDIREQAHRSLLKMGMMLRQQIETFDDGGSAERKKHLADLRKEFDELLEDLDEEDASPVDTQRSLIRGDQVNTPDFTVVGKIEQPSFQIASRYGQLTIRLQDIRFADRDVPQERREIRKTVAVPGTTFFQKGPKSTRIRVNKGDQITIRGSGTINWTNWNNMASPEGLSNQGNWNGISCGALAASVGKSGSPMKIGSKHSFVAKRSGVLYLGIAMKDNFASNNSYRWEGEFKARVVVKPAVK